MSAPGPCPRTTLHASAVVVGEAGILIRGASGAGKSSLALDLTGWAAETGHHGALVCDDRVVLLATGGRLVARPVEAIAGLVEVCGVGIVPVAHAPAAVIRLVVDLGPEPDRHPPAATETEHLLGVELPRIAVNCAFGKRVVLWRLGHLHDLRVTVP